MKAGPDEVLVIRDGASFSDSEIREIVAAVRAFDSGCDQIHAVRCKSWRSCEVTSGTSNGSLSGHGNTYVLEFRGRKWVVITTAPWISHIQRSNKSMQPTDCPPWGGNRRGSLSAAVTPPAFCALRAWQEPRQRLGSGEVPACSRQSVADAGRSTERKILGRIIFGIGWPEVAPLAPHHDFPRDFRAGS